MLQVLNHASVSADRTTWLQTFIAFASWEATFGEPWRRQQALCPSIGLGGPPFGPAELAPWGPGCFPLCLPSVPAPQLPCPGSPARQPPNTSFKPTPPRYDFAPEPSAL